MADDSSPVLANGFQDLIERQVLLPLIAVARVVAGTGSIQAEEPGKSVHAQFAFQQIAA